MTCNDLFSICLFTALLAVSVIVLSVFVVYVCVCGLKMEVGGGGGGGRHYNSGSCLGQRRVGVLCWCR